MKHHDNWLIVAIMCGLAAACSDPQGDFESARQADTRQAYDAFLEEYPQGEYADRARARIEQMERDAAWETAQREGTAEAFGAFLNQYPDGAHSEEAMQRRTELEREAEWERLSAQEDVPIESLSEFAATYPDSTEAAQARSMIAALETERAAQADNAVPETAPGETVEETPAPAGPQPAAPSGDFRVQLGAYRAEGSANEERGRLQEAHGELLGEITVEAPEAGSGFHRIRSAPMTRELAREACAKLEELEQACIVVDR